MTAAPQFMLIHKEVMNDFPCPECRTFEISFHVTFDDACRSVRETLPDEAYDHLCRRANCWVDEWERRRNGDLYCIIPIYSFLRLDLHNLKRDSSVNPVMSDEPVTFASLVIRVDKEKECPYNVEYELSFGSKDTCIAYLRDSVPEEAEEKAEDYELVLARLSPTWIKTGRKTGVFLELLLVEPGRTININERCAALSYDQWKLNDV